MDAASEHLEQYKKGSQMCMLHKSLYGNQQASRLWDLKLNYVLREEHLYSYLGSRIDYIYSSRTLKEFIERKFKGAFRIKETGPANQCLDISLSRLQDKVILDREKYNREILARFRMSECKPVKTAFKVNTKYDDKKEQEKCAECPYRQAVVYLIYVAQPDKSIAVNSLSRFNKTSYGCTLDSGKKYFQLYAGYERLELR